MRPRPGRTATPRRICTMNGPSIAASLRPRARPASGASPPRRAAGQGARRLVRGRDGKADRRDELRRAGSAGAAVPQLRGLGRAHGRRRGRPRARLHGREPDRDRPRAPAAAAGPTAMAVGELDAHAHAVGRAGAAPAGARPPRRRHRAVRAVFRAWLGWAAPCTAGTCERRLLEAAPTPWCSPRGWPRSRRCPHAPARRGNRRAAPDLLRHARLARQVLRASGDRTPPFRWRRSDQPRAHGARDEAGDRLDRDALQPPCFTSRHRARRRDRARLRRSPCRGQHRQDPDFHPSARARRRSRHALGDEVSERPQPRPRGRAGHEADR